MTHSNPSTIEKAAATAHRFVSYDRLGLPASIRFRLEAEAINELISDDYYPHRCNMDGTMGCCNICGGAPDVRADYD